MRRGSWLRRPWDGPRVGEEGVGPLRRIHDAFVQRNFFRDWTAQEVRTYRGLLDPTNLRIEVAVEVYDVDFIKPIRVRLVDISAAWRHIPHVLAADLSLCYFEPKAIVLDRYNPGGSILQCLDRAEKVIRDAINGRLDSDFADEFLSYWESDGAAYVDLPVGFEGRTEIRFLKLAGGQAPKAVLSKEGSWLLKARTDKGLSLPDGEPCQVLRTDRALTINPAGHWPPDKLSDLNDWLRWIDPRLVGRLEQSFVCSQRSTQSLAIAAANGTFLARVTLPLRFQTKEFTTTRRAGLPALLGRIADEVSVERFGGFKADTAYIFGRNMGETSNLGGKRILLIGCGTIGGFLAHQLAQMGAGTEAGRLTLMDTDVLQTGNLGRHLLGVPYLGRNKAEGCRDFLSEHLPMLDVVSRTDDALVFGPPMHLFDLVVDATGEEAVSIALNDRGVRARPAVPAFLFCWLVGNGAAAQCLTISDPDKACFKCLKPELAGEPRYRTLRKDVEVVQGRNIACGDAHFIPFPVSRSVAAAALACEAALDWANGKPEPRFRSVTLDRSRAFQVKDASPATTEACPACGAVRRA